MNTGLHTPEIEPVRDADFGFGVWPWAQGPLFELGEPWTFTVMNGGFEASYTIPKGYLFDKASIPPLFWGIGIDYTPDGLCTVASLEHDFLCDLFHGGSGWLRDQFGGHLPASPPAPVIHRHFYDVLTRWGVRPRKARLMWAGVRNFGPGGRLRPSVLWQTLKQHLNLIKP